MTSVITGDIINSRRVVNQGIWLNPLKEALKHISKNNTKYEIFRGDSFQVEVQDIPSSFKKVIYLKACIKSIKGFDVRLAIGIGDKNYIGTNVSESNGEAFVYSGQAFKTLLSEKVNLKIMSKHVDFDRKMNLYFKLALIAMDNWTSNSAEVVRLSLENPKMIQAELAQLIGISQDAVSKRQKRAYLDEILELEELFRSKTSQL
ncbi:SatD family protein [Winogradskyella ursingii]|uniref:SatD family protein n=1 Tax=Winogradskyella ursingii TaxID=2686079 RepID=UPI0015CB4D77|nr:SatD family protein [Winogradskyella ursingii]